MVLTLLKTERFASPLRCLLNTSNTVSNVYLLENNSSAYKKGLVLTLLHRIYSISSNWRYIVKEVTFLQRILKLNGYPTSLIDKCVSQFFTKIHTNVEKEDEQVNNTWTLTLPYLGAISLKLKQSITKYMKLNVPNYKLRVVFTSKKRLANFFSFKDHIPLCLNSHLVYKVNCAECNLCYYGLTERHFKVRAFDHLGLSIFTGKPIKGVDTAIKTHCRQENHKVTMDDISIIARAKNSFHLRIKESLLIKRDKPSLNNNIYSTPLSLF